MHDLTVFFLPVNPLDRRRPTIRLDSPHAGGDGSLTIIIESIEKLRENRASAAANAQNPNNCAPRATSRRHINERASANADFSERESVQVTSSVCSLSRLRGRVGEGVNRMIYHVACPLPVPPPQAGEGTVWHCSS